MDRSRARRSDPSLLPSASEMFSMTTNCGALSIAWMKLRMLLYVPVSSTLTLSFVSVLPRSSTGSYRLP